MSALVIVTIILSGFLALNIGANNSAASMATSYGAGVRSKRQAVWLIAIFALLGALTAGAPVVETVGKGIVPAETLSSDIGFILIILLLGIGFIAWANIARTPIATTHAIVCSIVGIGLYTQTLNSDSFIRVHKWWIVAPIAAWAINFVVAKFFYFKIVHYLASNFSEKRVNVILTILITISGTFIAFSGGANNSANAIGPIVSLGLIDSYQGAIIAGVAMGVGAILLGGRVLETLGKKITEICIIRAISVEFTAAVIILLASFYGIPVSIAEIVMAGVVGFSCAQHGFAQTARNSHVVKIGFFWFIVPVLTVGASYFISLVYIKYGLSSYLGFLG
ncbi:MAG: inorganic phosphate transporter [Candidatus Dadabacteria bacterium]|nr:inorganic phosphate transporter [Candidatus Dadabacteria bacterium]